MVEIRTGDQEFYLSDNDVVLNFIDCIKKMYPCLIKGNAYCYDSWDTIVEPLYFELVHNYLPWKYFGIGRSKDSCHAYETVFGRSNQAFIQCIPTSPEIPIYDFFGESVKIDHNNIVLVFIAVSDGKHNLTGSLEKFEAEELTFNMVEAEIVNINRTGNSPNERCFISLSDISFKYCPGE